MTESAIKQSVKTRAYSAPAAEKALDILEYMAKSNRPQKQNEIAAGVGRSQNEVYRIILLLEQRGYISRDPRTDLYVLTLKLFQLAHTTDQIRSLSETSFAPMQDLSMKIKQSCHLAVLTGATVTIVSQINSPLEMKYSVSLGKHFLAQQTSSGLVLLAGKPSSERTEILKLIEKNLEADESLAEVNNSINGIIERGYDVRPSHIVTGVTNISFPIYNENQETIAALTIPFLPIKGQTGSIEDAIEAGHYAAKTICYGLGFRFHQ